MCKPYSCIIKSDLTLIEGKTVATHSHTEILKQHGLPTEISVDQYARVELVPTYDENDYGTEPETWKVILDENRAPSWWEENLPEIEDRVKRAAEKWKARLLAVKKWHVVYGEYFICFGDMKPELTVSGGAVWTYGNSKPVITTVSGGAVWTYGNSKPVITTVSGGEVRTYENSKPVIKEDTRC